jgi:UDP-N-acetylglucosamine 2-epimerase (non-hydrolysing)
MRERIESRRAFADYGVESGAYLVVTLHRPTLVDGPLLGEAMAQLSAASEVLPVVFPVHPRTRAALETLRLEFDPQRVQLIEPVGYVEFLSLVSHSAAVLTDSGGIQEETTYLGKVCFTLRSTTERPITVSAGTNTLLGLDPERIREVPQLTAAAVGQEFSVPPLWDGRAADRVVDVLERFSLEEPVVARSG